MVELFFLKRFLLKNVIPYGILIISISYIIFEIACPRSKKEYFYTFSDKLFFRFVKRPFNKIVSLFKEFLIYLKGKLKIKILKNRDKKEKKENKKKIKELEANEKSKNKLNKKIEKMNKKASKKEMRKLFMKCLLIKIKKIFTGKKGKSVNKNK